MRHLWKGRFHCHHETAHLAADQKDCIGTRPGQLQLRALKSTLLRFSPFSSFLKNILLFCFLFMCICALVGLCSPLGVFSF